MKPANFDKNETVPVPEKKRRVLALNDAAQPEENEDFAKPGPSNIDSLARTADRYGVSDRVAAAIATSVLEDLGIVTEIDNSNVIDRSRVRRARSSLRLKEKQSSSLDEALFGIYFDGRKDQTLQMIDGRR